MLRPIRPSTGQTPPPQPSVSAEDDAVPGPSGVSSAGLDGRASSESLARGRKFTRRPHPAGGSAAAARRARTELAGNVDFIRLKTVCDSKGIEIKETLYTLLDSCLEEQKLGLINKLICFFTHVDPQRVKSTSPITGMMGQSATGRSIRAFLMMSDADIAWVASHEHLRSISSICGNKGMPAKAQVENFLLQPWLYEDGQVNVQLLRLISSIYNGRGFPENYAPIAELLALPALCVDGKPDQQLLGSLSLMCRAKGVPAVGSLNSLLALDCLRSDGKVNPELFGAVASICHNKGLPDPAKVRELFTQELLQKNGKTDLAVLRVIARMCAECGIPSPDAVQTLLSLPCLNNKDAAQKTVLDIQALTCIAIAQAGLGLPELARIEALSRQSVLYQNGQFDCRVLRCIAELYHKKGWPGEAELQRLLALPGMCSPAGINIAMLRCVAALGGDRGFPSDDHINTARNWLSGKDISAQPDLVHELLQSSHAEIEFITLGKWLKGPHSRSAQKRAAANDSDPHAAATPGKRIRHTVPASGLADSETTMIEQEKQRLLALCQQRKIKVSKALHSLIDSCPNHWRVPLMQKIACFLKNVNTDEVKSTATLTSMLKLRTKNHGPIELFLRMSDEDIASVARSRWLTSTACMCNGKGLPTPTEVQALQTMPELQVGGHLDLPLFRSIVAIYNGKGVPSVQAVKALLAVPAFQMGGVFNQKLFSAIASMYHSKGFPKPAEVAAFLQLNILRKADGTLDLERLKSIAVICRRKGLPNTGDLTSLLSHRAFVRGGRFDPKWFASIVTMCSSKGLPNLEQLDRLLSLRELMVDGETSLQLLKCVASLNHSLGLPAVEKVQALFAVEELLVDGRLNISALNCICALFHGKGIPSPDQVKSLLQLKELQTDDQLNLQILAHIASMHLRKGMPDLGNVSRLLSLDVFQSQGQLDVQPLKCLARIFHGKGIPQAEDISQFISRHKLAPGGQLNLPLLQQIAKLCLHTGFPKDQIVAQARADLSAWGQVEDIDDDDDDVLGIDALADLSAEELADADIDMAEDDGEEADAPRASVPASAAQVSSPAVVMGDGIADAAPVAEHAGSPGASDGFELPDDFDVEQAATGLSFGFWESGFAGGAGFDELLASTSTSTSAEAALQPAQDPGQQLLATLDFWESFTMPVDSTAAEDAVPSTSSAPSSTAPSAATPSSPTPSSPTLVGKARSYLASSSKDKDKDKK